VRTGVLLLLVDAASSLFFQDERNDEAANLASDKKLTAKGL
jgi:hypothetical protein